VAVDWQWERLISPPPVGGLSVHPEPEETKVARKLTELLKAVEDFQTYIEHNAGFIPNYGERWRYGERSSTVFVESTVNQVISKPMVKKPQMRWSPQGAHPLLQVRTQVLHEDLRTTFGRWSPIFVTDPRDQEELQAA